METTNLFTISSIARRVLLLAMLTLMTLPSFAQDTTLDGRRFDGVFIQRGKTSGDADTITFQGGRFRSSACDRYGYNDAPYRVNVEGDMITFETETESAKYGKLVWRGVIRGDKLDATATMMREGKAPIENWVVAVTPKK